jgi:hypothetical protein
MGPVTVPGSASAPAGKTPPIQAQVPERPGFVGRDTETGAAHRAHSSSGKFSPVLLSTLWPDIAAGLTEFYNLAIFSLLFHHQIRPPDHAPVRRPLLKTGRTHLVGRFVFLSLLPPKRHTRNHRISPPIRWFLLFPQAHSQPFPAVVRRIAENKRPNPSEIPFDCQNQFV